MTLQSHGRTRRTVVLDDDGELFHGINIGDLGTATGSFTVVSTPVLNRNSWWIRQAGLYIPPETGIITGITDGN